MNDLVTRLRYWADNGQQNRTAKMVREAAEEIERAEAEIKRRGEIIARLEVIAKTRGDAP